MEKRVYTNDNESKPICDVCGKEFDVEDLNGAYSGECLCPSCVEERDAYLNDLDDQQYHFED